ncbi:MAG: PQQ-binding-like beta-propeller repeat protein [Planctomycetota bacterium]
MRLFLIKLFVVLILLPPSGSVQADDWPRWMGPDYDGVWKETGMIDQFPESGPQVVWRQDIGSGYAGPSVAGDHVFVMDRQKDEGTGIKTENNIRQQGPIEGVERVLCLDRKTGQIVWTHSYPCEYKIAYPTGPRCTPTVDGDFVFTLGAMGKLICLNRVDGNVVWEKELTEEYSTQPPLWGYASHPYVDGDQLIVPVGGKGSGLVCFDKSTGKELWKSVSTKDIAYSPVVIYEPENGERQLIFWHGEGITAVDPKNGNEFWNVAFPEEPNPSIVTIATPVITGNQVLIAEFYKGALMLELDSNPPSVKEVWRNFAKNPKLDDAMNAMMATPVVKAGYAYGIGYTRRGGGVMRCIQLDSAEMKWNNETWLGGKKPQMFSNAFITPNEDKYFLFNDLGELMIGKLSTEGFEELDRAKLLEPTSVARGRNVVWSHPAYANGAIIVRNDKEIVCVNLKK